MRKVVIIFSVLICITSSCRQTTKKQTEESINFADTLTFANDADTLTFANDTDSAEAQNMKSNPLFGIQEIDSVAYFTLKKNANIQKTALEKLTDLEQVKEILKGRVMWGKYDYEENEMSEDEQGTAVYKIEFRNGKTLLCDDEMFFVAYFPQEDVLLLEGVHSSEIIFNLTTSEEQTEVGNPEHRHYSPSKQYRLNTYDNGQVPIYFIQKKSETQYVTSLTPVLDSEIQYTTIINLTLGSELEESIGFIPEYLADAFWQSDTILNFIAPQYFYPEDKTVKMYYQLNLK